MPAECKLQSCHLSRPAECKLQSCHLSRKGGCAGACSERDACRGEIGCLTREVDRLHGRCRDLVASAQVRSPANGSWGCSELSCLAYSSSSVAADLLKTGCEAVNTQWTANRCYKCIKFHISSSWLPTPHLYSVGAREAGRWHPKRP